MRQTFIIFKILFDNKDTLLHRIKLGFLLILNSQLSNCSFFRIANNINAIKSRVNFGTPYIYILWRVIISKHANYVDGGRGLSTRREKLVTQGSLASLADSLASTSAKLDPENLKIVSPTPAE